jgi:hypothetical protein
MPPKKNRRQEEKCGCEHGYCEVMRKKIEVCWEIMGTLKDSGFSEHIMTQIKTAIFNDILFGGMTELMEGVDKIEISNGKMHFIDYDGVELQ